MTVFLVTGCASGIGRHLAETLVARGERVVATDVDEAKLRAAAAGWPAERTRVRALDVRDPAAWDAAVDEAVAAFGTLDVLLNVAGFLRPAWVCDVDPRDVDLHFDVNTKGVVLGTRAAARQMTRQGGGHIVNVASLAALAPVPGLSLYSASKYAVRAFSLAAAHELRAKGVHVSVVCPDAVQTPMLDVQKDREEAALTFSGPRVLTVEDVARVILGEVLASRPLEVFVPRHRGWMARVADVFPTSGRALEPVLRRVGRRRQRRA